MSSIREYIKIGEVEEYIEIDFDGGTHITIACEQACELAANKNKRVRFDFNGIVSIVSPTTTPKKAVQKYNNCLEERREAYKNSPEYLELQKKWDEEEKVLQELIDVKTEKLTSIVNNQDELINWIGEFAATNDNSQIKIKYEEIIAAFKSAGYSARDFSGMDKDEFDSKSTYASFIVSEAIKHLRMTLPIHPLLETMCNRYKTLTTE